MKTYSSTRTLLLTCLLTACEVSHGGGNSGLGISTNTFDLRTGYARLLASGFSKTLAVSGTCGGIFSLTYGPATTPTTFEGVPAFSARTVASFNFSNCASINNMETTTRYYDTNHASLGYAILGANYGVWLATPTLPTAVKVGDIVVVGTVNRYTDNTKTTSAGKQENSFVIEPDTPTTAIANLISKSYNTSNVLTSTEQDRYRIAADGTLSLISIDIQYANGSTTHLMMN